MSQQTPETFNSTVVERTPEWAWALLLAAARHTRAAAAVRGSFRLGAGRSLEPVPAASPAAALERDRDGAWATPTRMPGDLQALFDLYLPVCAASAASPLAIGHLGQSIDGYIATGSGDSNYVTGPENILHLHRMRALCDAVVVGAGTVVEDDPRLTTRLADGSNPVRVILDPRRRLRSAHRVFNDGEAPTLLVCGDEFAASGPDRIGTAEIVGVPCPGGSLDLEALLDRLRARGLHCVFVEGGGTTVSRFLEAGLLDRMQIAIAPLVIGRGRPGLRLPANQRIDECLRPAHRVFAMGADVLFDCDLRHSEGAARASVPASLRRIY